MFHHPFKGRLTCLVPKGEGTGYAFSSGLWFHEHFITGEARYLEDLDGDDLEYPGTSFKISQTLPTYLHPLNAHMNCDNFTGWLSVVNFEAASVQEVP